MTHIKLNIHGDIIKYIYIYIPYNTAFADKSEGGLAWGDGRDWGPLGDLESRASGPMGQG
jgi:hypothetical protein